MPQTVKIQTGYSDKTTENYNSTQHSISLEMDCAINGSTREIEEASNRLFSLCRKIVSVQKGVNVDSLLNHEPPASAPLPTASAASASNPNPMGNGDRSPRLASSKQIKYLLELAKKANWSHDEIVALPAEFNKRRFEELTSHEASSLIERFGKKKAA